MILMKCSYILLHSKGTHNLTQLFSNHCNRNSREDLLQVFEKGRPVVIFDRLSLDFNNLFI